MPWYFAYGSNLNTRQMRKRIGKWEDSRRAVLKNHRLDFDKFSRGRWYGGVADVVECVGKEVVGAVYMITEQQLEKLDFWETGYERSHVIVECDSKPIETVTYKVIDKEKFHAPSEKYIETVLEGLLNHGYSRPVVLKIKSEIESMT